jgi:hypothetical protein
MKQAEVLGMGYKTIDRWLQKSINCNEIQHVAHGIYSKSIDKIAQAVLAVSAVIAVLENRNNRRNCTYIFSSISYVCSTLGVFAEYPF